jgi:aminoglycoside 3-N-acetyltransferase
MDKNEQCSLILNGLRGLGISEGDTLLVHSSLKSLGTVEGGAATVISALLAALGKKGTLLMPALTYTSVNPENPLFSSQNTPVCVGAISEYFRTLEGTVRSMHPTHSVCAYGYAARELTQDHFKDTTPVGANSPFSQLRRCGGKILMLGCGLRPNTSMHGVEELVKSPYLFKEQKTIYTLVDCNGKAHKAEYICHNFRGVIQRYDRIDGIMSKAELKQGKVLHADCSLIDAKALWNKAYEKLCVNPLYFVDEEKTAGN